MGTGNLGYGRRGSIVKALIVLASVVALIGAGFYALTRRQALRTPAELYRSAQASAAAQPARAAEQYRQLGERLPQIEEYTVLWAAEAALAAQPSLDAVTRLQDVIAYRPQSPAAYEAHVALARYYAASGAGARATDEYRAALALDDTESLRLELARSFEAQGDRKDAYAEYVRLLNLLPDAFEGVRRTGPDPVTIARDLLAAGYDSDAVDTLRTTTDPAALPLRAQALTGLERYSEAETAYSDTLKTSPDDAGAKLGLAGLLGRRGKVDEALALYRSVDTADSQLAQADLLADKAPDQALALYESSSYPVAWWSATSILEGQGRLTETLPLYAKIAASDASFADDAAYRLTVLASRTGDRQALAEGKAALAGMGLDWLAARAAGSKVTLDAAPPLVPGGQEILARAQALDSLGRSDLARLELVLAARYRLEPEVTLAMAQALAARGDVETSQSIVAGYLSDHPYAPLAFWKLSYPQPYSPTVAAAAREFATDPLLIWSVMRQESKYDPAALSYVGARGLMQVMPDTQSWIAEQLKENVSPGDAFTPEASIRMGTWYLHYLAGQFDGDTELAVAAYNGGAASVQGWEKDPRVKNRDDLLRWIGFGQTREYVEQVMLNYEVYQALYGAQ